MILALAVMLGLVASIGRHGGQTLNFIRGIPLRSAWLALLALALQIPLLRSPIGPGQQVAPQKYLFLLSHLLLLALVWRNRRLTGFQILGLGIACNLLVILVNGGFMPITPETLARINPWSTAADWPVGFHYGYSKDLILLRPDTNLWILSDILVLPLPFPWPTAFSLGDLLIAMGVYVSLQGPVALFRPAVTEALRL